MAKQRLEKDHIQTQTEINRRFQDKRASIDEELDAALKNIDWKRRKEAEKSLDTWVSEYMIGLILNSTPPEKGKEVLREMQKAMVSHSNTLLSIARGQGKTSYCQCAGLYAIATGIQKYVVIISANQKSADNLLSDFYKVCMEQDTKFSNDYPDLCLPFQLCAGSLRRRQLYNGVSTDLVRNSGTLQFARLVDDDGKDLATSGSIIETRGYTGQLRGMKRISGGKSLRPTLCLLDDWEDEDTASNPTSVEKMWDIINKDIIPMGGEQRISLLATQTPLCADDLVEKIKKDKHWTTLNYPAIISYPKNMDLWNKYFEMYDQELVMKYEHTKSLKFYQDNFDDMNEGSEVFNPARFCKEDGHISAIQKLLEIKNTIGEAPFASEYQMCPLKLKVALPITPDIVASRISDLRELEVPSENVRLVVASSDLNISKYITTVILACMRDGSYVVIYREFYKTSIQANVPPEEYDRQLYNTLSDLGNHLKSLGIKINCWSIDGNGLGWNAVTKFAKHSKSICNIPACSFVGKASHLYRDHISSRLKESVNRTILCGDKDEQKKFGSGIRYTFWDTDWYREKVQKGFLQAVGNLGSISWYKGGDHTTYALQVCGEKLIDKKDQADGTTKYMWKDVGKDWDVLDALAQALACYGTFNFSDNTTGISNISQKKILRYRQKPKIKII